MLGIGQGITYGSPLGPSNFSVAFDGTGDIINFDNNFESTFQGDYTISCWVNITDGNPSAVQNIFGTTSSNSSIQIQLSTAGKWGFKLFSNSRVGSPSILEFDSSLTDGQATGWYNIVATMNHTGSATQSVRAIYANGGDNVTTGDWNTGNHHAAFVGNAQDDVFVGAFMNSSSVISNPMTGNVTDVAIWNTVLDADAVTAVYNSGEPFDLNDDNGDYDNSSALVAYWRMDEGTGTTINDNHTGGSEDGALVADASFSEEYPE